MLVIVPVATLVAISPLIRTLFSHVLLALDISKTDEWATRIWWNWPGSWILCSGPLGRWPIAAILGYVVIGNKRQRDREILPGYLVEEPHLRIFVVTVVALLLSCFSIVSPFSMQFISQDGELST